LASPQRTWAVTIIIGTIFYTTYAKKLYYLDEQLKEKRIENIGPEESELF